LVDRLWNSDAPAAVARLEAQARLIAAYEERKWARRSPSTADLIRHLMDQHDLKRADMVPILGTPSRVSEVLRGKKRLSMARCSDRARVFVSRPTFSFRRRRKWPVGARQNGLRPEAASSLRTALRDEASW
jgi:antitoxin component HigA of HigAB toxin-antitoxin module